jgi:hypothetical protein
LGTLDQATARALTASWLPNDVKYPYSISWNLGIQHIFGKYYTAEVRYVGTRGVHLNVQDRINVQALVTPTRFLPTYLTAPSQATLNSLPTTLASLTSALDAGGNILPAFAAGGLTNPIVADVPFGSSTYHGLATQVTRRFSNGLQFIFAWTWSHTIDNSTADFFSTVLTPRRPQDFQNLQADRSNSALDRAHRITFGAVYDLPWFKNSNPFMKNVVGNWEFAPTYTFETGEWADVQSAVDSNLNGDSAGDRVIFNPAGVHNTGSGVTALTNSGGATVAYLADNPTAQYIVAGQGALANSSRNTLQMPPIENFDLALLKRVSFTERLKIEMGTQITNLFNHPQFLGAPPSTVVPLGSGYLPTTLGTSAAVRNFVTPGTTNFNIPKLTFPSNARTMQISAKFIF